MRIRIGTRKSKLALAQTDMAAAELKKSFPDIEIEIVPITTRGDKVLHKPLSEMGGKGVFVGEIEAALQSGEIDLAVHSAKDLPAELGTGLEISGVLPRGNYRDVLVTLAGIQLDKGEEVVIGTGSERRRANLRRHLPNAVFRDIRGNVDTRLAKLKNGEYDGIVLAAAGLERLGIEESQDWKFTPFDFNRFLPAPCQGIIAMECREGSHAAECVQKISHFDTWLSFEAEREIVSLLGGDCSVPLGAYSYISGENFEMCASKNMDSYASGFCDIGGGKLLARELLKRL